MAVLANPNVFITRTRERYDDNDQAEHRMWRLAPHHVADLRDVARGVEESNAGIATRYLIDSLTSAGQVDIDEDGYIHHLHEIERFCDRYGIEGIWNNKTVITWRKRIARCRRALLRMRNLNQHKQTNILYVVHGYPDPSTRDLPKRVLDCFGEMASLARYTDIVEVKRQELARAEALRLLGVKPIAIAPTKDVPSICKKLDDEIAEIDERRQSGDEYVRMAINHGYTASHGGTMIDLMRHRDKYEWAMQVVSSGDALRAMFAPSPEREPGETSEHFKERKENAETKRDFLMNQVHIEISKMVQSASKAYHVAWLKSV